jgi:hypothetical protein
LKMLSQISVGKRLFAYFLVSQKVGRRRHISQAANRHPVCLWRPAIGGQKIKD